MVKGSELENPESDMHLVNRAPRGAKDGAEPTERVSATDLAKLKALHERVAAAKAAAPLSKDDAPHCGDCFSRGWRAAVRAIEGA